MAHVDISSIMDWKLNLYSMHINVLIATCPCARSLDIADNKLVPA